MPTEFWWEKLNDWNNLEI